jgi:aerobic-type carbon monoxide dehydrogenase small subunit (CoxS/CutS family)
MMPARHAQGHAIVTVEGLAQDEKLTPVQEAFVRNTAFQCGYCTPGIILASTALLNRGGSVTEDEIREGLAGNLCRCTGYVSIFKAVMEAAELKKAAQ